MLKPSQQQSRWRNLFFKRYESLLKLQSVKKSHLSYYLYLRALLAIRSGNLNDAENSLELLIRNNSNITHQANFLKAIALNGKGEKKKSFALLKQCLKDSSTRLSAALFLSSAQTLDRKTAISGTKINKELTTLFPKNIRISINLLICKIIQGYDIKECTNDKKL